VLVYERGVRDVVFALATGVRDVEVTSNLGTGPTARAFDNVFFVKPTSPEPLGTVIPRLQVSSAV
jgi:hypothetical protein